MLTRCCFLVLPAVTGDFPVLGKTMHYHRNRHYCTCFLSGIGDLFDNLRVDLVIFTTPEVFTSYPSLRESRSDLIYQKTQALNVTHSGRL